MPFLDFLSPDLLYDTPTKNSNLWTTIKTPVFPSANQLNSTDKDVIEWNRLARALFSSEKKYLAFKVNAKDKDVFIQVLHSSGYTVTVDDVCKNNKIKLHISW